MFFHNFWLTVTSWASQIIIITNFVIVLSISIKSVECNTCKKLTLLKTIPVLANSVDPDQLEKPTDLDLHYLSLNI